MVATHCRSHPAMTGSAWRAISMIVPLDELVVLGSPFVQAQRHGVS
jgi:hypothetical protein